MAQSLFFEPVVAFEKVAAEVHLPEDPNTWPEEIMQEAYKQCPYVADFDMHVTMDRVESERAYGFGHIELSNKTEIQHGADPDAMVSAGIKKARIPIVIKNCMLQPLDLLVTDDSKVLPLTEPRLRETLFRPQVFDITGRGPGDMSMIGQLYPPYRQNYGFGGGGATMNVGMGKESAFKPTPEHFKVLGLNDADAKNMSEGWHKIPFNDKDRESFHAEWRKRGMMGETKEGGVVDRAAAQGSILAFVLPTIREADYTRFVEKIAHDKGLWSALIANPAAGESIKTLLEYEPGNVRKLASTVLSQLKPTVAQLRKEAAGYTLKTAAHNCWLPEEVHLDRGAAVKLLGSKVVLAADTTGSATMTLGEGVTEPESPEQDQPDLVSQFGIYKVQDEQGRHLIGYVFPNLIDLDGTALPIALFTNGSQMAVQGDIAGINVGGGASLFEGPPSGKGVFYHLLPNGRAEATVPLTIKASMSDPEQGGDVLHAETFDGRQVQVVVQPNLEHVTPGPDGEHLLIPDFFSWLPLDKAEETTLVGDPTAMGKEGAARNALSMVTLRYGGSDSFSVDGLPVDKLASEQKHFISLDDTLFLLGALGTDVDYALKKLGQAGAWSTPVEVRVGRHIKMAADRLNEAARVGAEVLSTMPDLQVDLAKEAAVIPDPTAVDTVLSLGFLNPENLGMFIASLPEIDQAQQKMCELLLAARLGLQDVPAPALEKAVRSTEDVIEGLKILAFQR